MTKPYLRTLFVVILFNVQSILSRSTERWDEGDKLGLEKLSNTHWVVKLKLVAPNHVSRCRGILVETPKTKELGLSDTILMPPGCFGLDYVNEGPYYVANPDKYAMAFVESDSNGYETGLTDVINVRRILIHPKFGYSHNGYELAVVRLATPVKGPDNLKPAVLSRFTLTEVAECSLTGSTREFNFSIHSDEMILADTDRDEYNRFLTYSNVSLPEVEVTDENSVLVARIPSLSPNKLFFTDDCAPLLCWKDGRQLVQGLFQRKESESFFSARYVYSNVRTS
uniref:Peptidase S1 domain-containing protein n=1 Tax=Romanomermis culicivorax TaxID=13658 RepID=A0A915KA81_ROMCU